MDKTAAERKVEELEKVLRQKEEKIFLLENEMTQLKSDRDRYQLIADFSLDWEFWINNMAEFIWISPSCLSVTGYTSDEFFQDPSLFYSIVVADDLPALREFIRNSLSFLQIGQVIEFRILTRTKQLRWCEMYTKGVFDRSGNSLGQRGVIRDITRLKSALGQIKTLSERHHYDTQTQQKYRNELAGKDREMVTALIRIAQKNEIVLYLRRNLNAIRNTLPQPVQKRVNEMITRIDEHRTLHLFNWEEFQQHFEKIHTGFFSRLQGRHPQLSSRDLRLCAYIFIGLPTKEIAGLTNISPESVEIGRVRLRRKIGLDRSQNLYEYLTKI